MQSISFQKVLQKCYTKKFKVNFLTLKDIHVLKLESKVNACLASYEAFFFYKSVIKSESKTTERTDRHWTKSV